MERTEEDRGRLFLDELSAKTGGLSFAVRSREDIGAAAAHIRQALRNRYTIGYVPIDNGRSGRWRAIKITVARLGIRAYFRTEYRSN
jgi:hypothetical protein